METICKRECGSAEVWKKPQSLYFLQKYWKLSQIQFSPDILTGYFYDLESICKIDPDSYERSCKNFQDSVNFKVLILPN